MGIQTGPVRRGDGQAPAIVLVLYDRHAKRVAAGLETPHTVAGRGFDEPDHMADAVGVH